MTPLREIIEDHEDKLSSLRAEDRIAYVQGIRVECPVEHPGVRGYWASWRDALEREVQRPLWSPSVINFALADELTLPEFDE